MSKEGKLESQWRHGHCDRTGFRLFNSISIFIQPFDTTLRQKSSLYRSKWFSLFCFHGAVHTGMVVHAYIHIHLHARTNTCTHCRLLKLSLEHQREHVRMDSCVYVTYEQSSRVDRRLSKRGGYVTDISNLKKNIRANRASRKATKLFLRK